MNPVALYLASGESLYVGAGLLLAVVALTPWVRGRWRMRARMLAVWVALALMVMACPPFAWAVDILFGALFIIWLALSGKIERLIWRRAGVAAAWVLAALLVLLPAMELPWRAMPVVRGNRADHLTVIGDSISAGIGNDDTRWPVVFEKLSGVPVKNLSRAGDQVADALDRAKKLTAADTLVLLEIGGNDLIAGTSTEDFQRQLATLLAACCVPGRTVVMFELPLLPHRIGYGQSQRRLAEKYGVTLIPKRCLIDVLRAGTSDGLHLSPESARAIAELVRGVMAPVLPVDGRG